MGKKRYISFQGNKINYGFLSAISNTVIVFYKISL